MSAADFKALKTYSQIKRAENRKASVDRLRELGIEFVEKNRENSHLIVAGAWDFWPGTGKWKHRDLPTSGRGVRGLISAIREHS